MKTQSKRIPLKRVLEKELKDAEFQFYFEKERAVSRIARMIRDARIKANLTQAGLAKRALTSQAVIARIESASDSRIPSLALLERLARALKAKLLVSFEYDKAA